MNHLQLFVIALIIFQCYKEDEGKGEDFFFLKIPYIVCVCVFFFFLIILLNSQFVKLTPQSHIIIIIIIIIIIYNSS